MEETQRKLIEDHLWLLHDLAGMLFGKVPGEYGDLVNDGYFGLHQAAHSFDSSRGIQFTTYARRRIVGEVFDAARRRSWIPRLQMRREKAGLVEKGTREQSLQSMLDLNDEPFDPIGEDGRTTYRLCDKRMDFEQFLSRLKPKQRRMAELYWLRGLTMTEIANDLGCCEANVSRQIAMLIDRHPRYLTKRRQVRLKAV